MDDPRLSERNSAGRDASSVVEVDASRRQVLLAGLAAMGGGLTLAGCSGAREPDVATPPRAVVQTRPVAPPPVDPRPTLPTVEPVVRILCEEVKPVGTVGAKIAVRSTGRWIRLQDRSGAGGTVLGGPIECTLIDGSWRIVPTGGVPFRIPAGAISVSVPPGESGPLSTRRGASWTPLGDAVDLVPTADQKGFDLVARLPMEVYLPGVLAKELYSNWSPATFRAQAVAARSFATCETAHWRNRRHYDVTTGPDTQAWSGLVASGPAAKATGETRGILLAWDRRVVPAYYSSCCGGLPAEARDAISQNPANEIAPLAGRSDRESCCDWASTYRWSVTIRTQLLGRRLAEWGRREGVADLAGFGAVRSMEVSAVGRHGRPVRFRVEDAGGRHVELRAERGRRALAFATEGFSGRLYSAFIEPRVAGDVVILDGRGHGHGVGLCQHGAEAMARRGRDAESILRRYYPGATLETGWT